MKLLDPQQSHQHSLTVLNTLYEYDDFMESINTLVDLGCGDGLDLEWWATRTTRDETPEPLNIKCTGIDVRENLPLAHKYTNIVYQRTDYENITYSSKTAKFDVLWCHNAFQYCINPVATLNHWWHIANDGAMLILMLPQTTNIAQRQQIFTQGSGCYHHYTLVNLIHMLSVNGWDCGSGFFLKRPDDPWLHAIVYKSTCEPFDPKSTSWHQISEAKLLPECAEKSIYAHDFLRQQDLVLPWIDKSIAWLGKL
jgi:SAM-dependent methyltransferase